MKIKDVQYNITPRHIPEKYRNAGCMAGLNWWAGKQAENLCTNFSCPLAEHTVQKQSPTPLNSSLILMSTPVFIPSISQGHQHTRGIHLRRAVCVSGNSGPQSTSWDSSIMRATGWKNSIINLSRVWIYVVFLTTKDANTLNMSL